MKEFLKTYAQTRRRARANSYQGYQKYQQSTLQRLIGRAKAEVPFHRDRLGDLEWRNLDEIPPCTKGEMQADLLRTINPEMTKQAGFSTEDLSQFLQGYRVKGSPWFGRFAMLAETNGTSGSKGLYFRTKKELARRDGMVIGRSKGNPLAKYIRHWRLRRAVVLSDRPGSSSFQSTVHAARKYALFMQMRIFSSLDDEKILARELKEFRPHTISCPRNYLLKLAKLQLSGLLDLNPLSLGTGGSRLTEDDIKLLQEAFPGVRVGNLYGATECSPIASTCREGRMHQYMDGAVLECVDQNNLPTPQGTYSHHVLVTSLLRHFQPIIRYRLDDSVKVDPEPCPCGSVLPVLHVKGRSDPSFPVVLNDGTKSEIASLRFFELMVTLDYVRHYQIISDELNHFKVIILVEGTNEDLDSFESRYREGIDQALMHLARSRSCDRTLKFDLTFQLLDALREKDRQAFVLRHP